MKQILQQLTCAFLTNRMDKLPLPPTYVKGFHDEESVRLMEYSEMGKTELLVSKISLGGGTLSQLYGYVTYTHVYILIYFISIHIRHPVTRNI